MARKSCLLRSQDDRETVRKPMGSEKASSRFSETDSEGRLPAPGAPQAAVWALQSQLSVLPFYAVQDLSHGTVIFPPQLTQCTSPLGEQRTVLTAKPIPIFNS